MTGGAGESEHPGVVLVGADGIHSWVRGGAVRPAGAEVHRQRRLGAPWFRQSACPEAGFGQSAPLGGGPGRHFVHYCVRGGALVNCVAVVEKAGWEVESWSEPGDQGELKADFAGWHEEIQTLIDCMDRGALYKWALHDRPPMPRWSKGAVTLLGDACHPMLPFMAQGAVTAIEDAAVLATCLAGGLDPRASLRRYENLRRSRTARLQAQARRNAKIFHLSGVPAWLRNRTAKRPAGASWTACSATTPLPPGKGKPELRRPCAKPRQRPVSPPNSPLLPAPELAQPTKAESCPVRRTSGAFAVVETQWLPEQAPGSSGAQYLI